MAFLLSGGAGENTGLPLFDDFTGTNGDPVNASNWSTSIASGSSITIQSNEVRLQNVGSTSASMTSLTTVKNGCIMRGTISYATSTTANITVKLGTTTLLSFGGSSGLGTASLVWGVSMQRKTNGKWVLVSHTNSSGASFSTGSTSISLDFTASAGALIIETSSTAGTHTVTGDNTFLW